MIKNRYLKNDVLNDLKEKMVFIGGPRQVGKTTLARSIISSYFVNPVYYNWDFAPDRKVLTNYELPGDADLLIFDELHKYKKWKPFVKGIYDKLGEKYKIIVTGSAHMDIYRKGGDSLQGRYHYYTLLPFSYSEMNEKKVEVEPMEELSMSVTISKDNFDALMKFGGFPEVLIKQNTRHLRRWQNEKLERLFREDIRDTENIRDLDSMKLLSDLLPGKVSAPLSINAIREDLEVSHRAVTNWLSILEKFYYHFRIYPYHYKLTRSVKKEPKLYLYDWSEVDNPGAKFENLIAFHLLKFVQYLSESEGYKVELYYLRNIDKKEVDFLVTYRNKPWFAVESKLSDTTPHPNLLYYKNRLKIPFSYQVVVKSDVDTIKDDVRIISADKFLTGII